MKKIMFNDKYGLTKAVLEGRKIMTRRVIPVDETKGGLVPVSFWDGKWCGSHGRPLKRQPYKVGEVVAVAQSYKDAGFGGEAVADSWAAKSEYPGKWNTLPGFTNKMFVQSEFMPHKIRITGIRVERLQDISDEDCMKEGIEFAMIGGYYVNYNPATGSRAWLNGETCREAFAALIDRISGKGTWDSNPYMFVYEFELVN